MMMATVRGMRGEIGSWQNPHFIGYFPPLLSERTFDVRNGTHRR